MLLASMIMLAPATYGSYWPTISQEKLMIGGMFAGIALSLYTLWHHYNSDYIICCNTQTLCETIQDLDERIGALEKEISVIKDHVYDQCQSSIHTSRQVEAMQEEVNTLHAAVADCQAYINNNISAISDAITAVDAKHSANIDDLNANLNALESRIEAILNALSEEADLPLPNVIYNCEVHVHCPEQISDDSQCK